MGIKEQQDQVAARSKPAAHVQEVVRAFNALLLTRENAGRVHQRDFVQQRAGTLCQLEFGQEAVAILRKALQQENALLIDCLILLPFFLDLCHRRAV